MNALAREITQRRQRIAILTLICLVLCACGLQKSKFLTKAEKNWLKENGNQVEVLFGYEAPPNAYHDEDGNYKGLLIDYMNEIELKLDYQFKVRNFKTWDELINYAKHNDNCLIPGIASTRVRDSFLLFTNAFIKIPYVIMTRRNSDLNSMKSLFGKKVCTTRNYAVNDYLAEYFPKMQPYYVTDDLEGLRAVSTGMADATVINQMYATYIIENQGITNLKIAGEVGYINRLSMGVSINTPELYQIMDKTVDQIEPVRQEELYRKWVRSDSREISPFLINLISATAAIAFILLVLHWFWLISLKHQVEKKTSQLRASKENLRITLNSIGEAMIATDIDGQIIRMNPVAECLTGWPAHQAIGQPLEHIFQIVDPLTGKTIKNAAQKVLASGETERMTNHTLMKSRDGNQYHIADSGAPIRDDNGTITGVVVIFRDVSDSHKMQESLRQNEAKYRSLIEDSNDAIFLCINQKFEIVNKKFEKLFGYDNTQLTNINFDLFQIIAPQSRHQFKKGLEKLFHGEPLETHFEIDGICKSGKQINLDISVSYINYKDGLALQGTLRDISQQKRNQEELIQARDKAKESDRLKSVFLANMSHEIRTPMNGILGFSELLKKSDLSIEQKNAYIKVIEQSGHRMLTTINDLIDISKIEAGQMEVKHTEFNLNDQLDYLHDFFEAELAGKNIQYTKQPGLSHSKATLRSDQDKVLAIFTNLLKNAVKFTQTGEIVFGYRRKDDQLECFVRDTGSGIPPERLKAIFDRFVQADLDATKAHEGSGLGLSIAKAYVKMLGGQIHVKSELNHGSEFRFTLPYQDLSPQRIEPTVENSAPNSIEHHNMVMLIVDDEEYARAYLTALFERKCKKLFLANNGAEAITICQQNNNINIVLLDIKMPGINGYETLKQIKQINPNLKVIAQTAYAMASDRKNAIDAGFDAYISKPINKMVLFELIDQLMG